MPRALTHVLIEHHDDAVETRDAIKDIWGPRTGYNAAKGVEWPVRVDQHTSTEPDKWVQSACVMCSNGCGMDIGVKDGKIVGVRGRECDRVNRGRLGPKGLNSWIVNHSEDRLTHPLIRNKDGQLVRASWDEAMDLIVRKTKETQEKLSNHGLAFYTSGQLFLEEYYTLATIGKAGLGSLHMDGNTRLCTATAAAAMRESFGCDGQPGSYTDIDYCDCIFIVGHNIAATQTVLWTRMLDRLAGPDPPKVVVMDPRSTSTAQAATVHIAPRIGTNVAVLNGLLNLLFEHPTAVDKEYTEKHTIGMENLRATVSHYSPEYVEQLSGVLAATLRAAAEVLGSCKRLLSTALQGVYQSNQATAAACQINNINLIRGMIGKEGAGVYQMNGQPTAQNNRETGCDGEYPGFRNPQNPDHMADLARHWNVDVNKVPHWSQPTPVMDLLSYIENGTIQFLWISGTNPAVSLPEIERVRQLLTKKDLFVIAQDIFPTETTQLADVVLPAAMWAEKTGCYTNVDRTVHISHKAIDPPGECKSDLDIWLDYAKRMDFRGKDDSPLVSWTDAEGAFEHWRNSTDGRPCDYSGISYELLSRGSGIQWPCNKGAPNGTERLYTDGVFPTMEHHTQSYGHDLDTGTPLNKEQYTMMNPNGRAILKAVQYRAPEETPDDEYPYSLSTGRRVYHFHTRTKTGRTKRLHDAMSKNFVQISVKDAEKLEVKDGDLLDVQSRRGVVRLEAKVGEIEEGQTFIPFHFGSVDATGAAAQAANELTRSGWDNISFQPFFKSGAVKLTKVTDETDSTISMEKHSEAIKRAEARGAPDDRPVDMEQRARHLEPFLGLWDESAKELIHVFDDLQKKVEPLYDMRTGIRLMRDMAVDGIHGMKPFVEKYHGDDLAGAHALVPMRRSLFTARSGHTGFDVIMDLHSLVTVISSILNILAILKPVSGALLDKPFQDAVDHATYQFGRIKQWAQFKAADKAPQALLVPAVKEVGAWPWEAQVQDTVRDTGERVVDVMAGIAESVAETMGGVTDVVKNVVASTAAAIQDGLDSGPSVVQTHVVGGLH